MARVLNAERQLEALVGEMEDAVTVLDTDGSIVMANPAAARLMHTESVEALLATPARRLWARFALYDAEGRPLAEQDLAWTHVIEGGRRPAPMLVRRVDRETGEQLWLLAKMSVLHDDSGRPEMAMYVTEDVTAEKRAELGQRLLVEAGRLLGSTLDRDAMLQQVAALTVPALTDWCAIDVPGPGGALQ